MANYSPTNFLVPTSSGDKTIQVRDKSGVVRYNVAPCNVVSSFVFSYAKTALVDFDGFEIGGLVKSGYSNVEVYFNLGVTGSVYLV